MVMPSQSALLPDVGSGAVLAPTSPPRVVIAPLAPSAEHDAANAVGSECSYDA
ncbi:hypothetical protein [Octadecabacter arcticus]|uniref:hypothetical protein n=1 Tax=Octadecabacter arcticus TaxID=53946 RepID=UPI0016513869|nr:hypothetical protein [Octadecabacter arcticus]